jgi:hypothetical protein
MSFAGAVLACWLIIAGVAFFALSGLARLTARGDIEADLGIVGEAELRMLVGERDEERLPIEALLGHLGISNPRPEWASHDGAGYGRWSYTT